MRPDVTQLRSLWQTAFGDPQAFLDLFFSAAFSPERCCYLSEDGVLAGALYWFDCFCGEKKIAYIYAVATDPQFRGRGFCRRLMEKTHAALRQQGYAGAVLVPGDPGLFEMYGKMGYRVMSGMDSFRCAAGKAARLQKLTREEYAALRRRFLPDGGILQEGENLLFLSQFAEFYAGEDFLLVASREDGKLFCPELLGSREAAPGITAALGCTEGAFRVPGSKPFAMYHALTEGETPAYFGLAFD